MNIITVADMGMPTQSSDPPLKKSKIETQPSKVYFLYTCHDSYGYKLYALDPSALGNWNGTPEGKIETLQPVLELPGLEYPMGMDAFAVGSTLYMIGGEIPLKNKDMDMIGGETPLENKDMDETFSPSRLSPSVYMCDTTALPLSVVEGPRMKGGKAAPFVIPVDNLIYVISDVPPVWTTFYTDGDETVLFEVFDPNEGSWSSLPRPPFYPRPDHCDMEAGVFFFDFSTCSIVNYAVVDSKIFFCTRNKTRMYAFHVHDHKWETFNLLPRENLFPFYDLAMSISDSAWISVGSGDSNSSLTTYNLASNLGLVRRAVEGLSSIVRCRPYLDFNSDYRLLDFKNGWFCLLIFGMDMDYFSGGIPHPHALASIFQLVKKHTDEVYLDEVRPWVAHRKLDPKAIKAAGLPMPHLHDLYDVFSVDTRVGSSKDHFDPEKRVGEVQVFGAEDLRG